MQAHNLQKGIYRHYKGQLYELIDVARHSETLEYLVIYKQLYGNYSLWIRPLSMFTEDVVIDGKQQKRFTLVS